MAKIHGIQSLLIGDPGANGAAGTTLTAVSGIVIDSVSVTIPEISGDPIYVEEIDTVYDELDNTEPDPVTVSLSTYEASVLDLHGLFGGTLVGGNGEIATFGTITAGSTYTNGTYTNVPLTGGTGTGATANVTVSGAAVTAVALVNPGVGYTVADSLSATAGNLGGTGSGFSIPVATLDTVVKYTPSRAGVEKTIVINTKERNGAFMKMTFPRVKIRPSIDGTITKGSLTGITINGTVLTPFNGSLALTDFYIEEVAVV